MLIVEEYVASVSADWRYTDAFIFLFTHNFIHQMNDRYIIET